MRVLQVDLGSPATGADGIPVAVASVSGPLATLNVESVFRQTHSAGLRRSLLDADATRQTVVDEGFDVVHLHSVFRPAHMRLSLGLRRLGVPYVVSPHSGLATPALLRDTTRKRLWIAAFERRYLSAAATVVCLSVVEAEDVRRVASGARTVVVPNAAPDLDVDIPRAPASEPTVLTLARYDVRQKGLDRLVAVARHCPGVTFTVHGGRDRNENALLDRLLEDLPSNVRFLPAVGGTEKAVALAQASVYFAPSRWEGLSMSVLEALRAGVPCIASSYTARTLGAASSHVLAIPDDVLDNQPAEAARMMLDVLGDVGRLVEMGRDGRVSVEQEFGSDAIARRLADAYESAV